MTQTFLIYLLAINVLTLIVSVLDKGLAVHDRRRVPERLLLTMSFSGGAAGAKLAQILSGHKSLNVDFCASLTLIAFLQLGLATAIWSETVRFKATSLYERFAVSLESQEAEAKGITRVSKDRAMPKRFGPGSD